MSSNEDGIGGAVVPIVFLESSAKAVGFHTHQGIQLRIVIGGAAKNLRADYILLELVAITRQGFFDDKAQEALELGRALKNSGSDHFFKSGAHFTDGERSRRRKIIWNSHGCPGGAKTMSATKVLGRLP